jgi:uncharacterized protein (DUF2062 family)
MVSAAENPRLSFWRRRIVAPIAAQLTQGVTPEKIALTIALGVTISVFPILGATTTLCALVGMGLRLNQPVIQLANYLAYPLQLMLLIPFYRAGERLMGRVPVPLSTSLFVDRIRTDLLQFLKDFGVIALGGVLVWLALAPLAVGLMYWVLRRPLRVLAKRSIPNLSCGN